MTRKGKSIASPRIRLVGWNDRESASAGTAPTAAATAASSAAALAVASLLTPVAQAAPGDLDPAFGNTGRADLASTGQLWSMDLGQDGEVLFSGQNEYCYYYYGGCELIDFSGKLLSDGSLDTDFAAAFADSSLVYDTALQSDGKVVATGLARSGSGTSQVTKIQVTRLLPDGSLDTSFGDGGRVTISDGTTSTEIGRSVLVDGQGRIVVAGSRSSNLLVARLLPNGTLDAGFGNAGTYLSSDVVELASALVIASSPDGYRLLAHLPQSSSRVPGSRCVVYALTESGVLEPTFGTSGVVVMSDFDATRECSSMASQSDGRWLLGGVGQRFASPFGPSSPKSFVARIMPDGSRDDTFVAETGSLSDVTALAVGATGAVYVAGYDGSGSAGATILRLFGDGLLDPSFGRGGTAIVEPETRRVQLATIRDIEVLSNDALLVGGGGPTLCCAQKAFAARLLGNGAGGGPGVLGMALNSLTVEEGGQATLTVRRTGGSTGAISVGYATHDFGSAVATAGQDYTQSSGRLSWGDGDTGDREIVIPITSDALTEVPERFEVHLEAPEGGAGIGAMTAEIQILGSGYPAGMFTLWVDRTQTSEGGQVVFLVQRDYYSQGPVSVTLRVASSGSATPGADFTSPGSSNGWNDVVLQWGDGDASIRQVTVPIRTDKSNDPDEMLTLEIVGPQGGAVVGTTTQASVTIRDIRPPNGSGGGLGASGWLVASLLGLMGTLRGRPRRRR
jgi:uncharacterized delta-60 repeat protein